MKKMGEPALKDDRIYTYGDYKNWPEGERWEIIDGTAWNMSPAPRRIHQKYLISFLGQIIPFLEDHCCEVYSASFDVLLPEHPNQREDEVTTVVQPDISVICDKSKLTPKGCTGAPDWIIEILSPYTSRKDIGIKFELYQHHGVREYWICDPGNKYLHVYLLDEKGRYPDEPKVFVDEGKIASSVVGGLVVNLGRIFAAEV
jgi:Uma2 family endonuclease